MNPTSTTNRILLSVAALAMTLLAACNGSGRTSIQPQPQAPVYPALISPSGHLILDQTRSGIGAQFAPLGGRSASPAPGNDTGQGPLERLLKRVNR